MENEIIKHLKDYIAMLDYAYDTTYDVFDKQYLEERMQEVRDLIERIEK